MRGTEVVGKRPLWVLSPGRRLRLSKKFTPAGAVRVRGTASSITEGGAGMMRQRQAAVPWLRRAPSPAANRAATRCPSSAEQFGRHRGIDTAVDEVQPAGAEGAIDGRAVDFSGQQLPPADNAVLLTSDDPN